MTSQPLKILMADDDLEDLELIEEAMKDIRPGVQFHKFTNGRAVLKYLEDQPDDQLPCLIILDYNMPELKGSEVLSELHKGRRYAHISKIVLSTSSSPAYINECKDNGANDYFVKPTNMKDLNVVVQKMMAYCR